MSPYIFTLVMEVLSLILRQQISESDNFKFHWGCKDLQISHLCFADDLLVLCHGDVNSVKVVKKALDKFSAVSGLHPNMGKSIVFLGMFKTISNSKSWISYLSKLENYLFLTWESHL